MDDSSIESAASVNTAGLDVILDHPNRLFMPGDTITGSVHGWDPSTSESSLEISLLGRSKTYIKHEHHSIKKARSLLTYQTTRLEPSDHVGSSIAKFSLRVPQSVETNPSDLAEKINDGHSYWKHSWSGGNPAFKNSGGHRLPPSMSMPHREIVDDSTSSGWGHIQYTVTAAVSQGEGNQTSKTESCPKTVRISGPYVTAEELEQFKGAMLKCTGGLSFDRKTPNKKTFSWRMRSALKLYPLLWLAPVINVSKTVVVGEDINISIQLQPSRAEHRFDLPPISLRQVTARLRDTAGIRGNRAFQLELPGDPSASKTWKTKHRFDPAEGGKSYQNAPCQVTFNVPRSCIPTFKTYNFYMKWNVALELVFKGAGQEKIDEKIFKVESEIDVIPRLRGITTNEEPEEDAVDLEAPGGVHNLRRKGSSGALDTVGNLIDAFTN